MDIGGWQGRVTEIKTMGLYPEEVERAEPRDTQADVDAIIEALNGICLLLQPGDTAH